MPLPKDKTPPKTDLSALTVLVYGQPKIGKSTFCASAEGALFLACEAGLNSLNVHQLPVNSWLEMGQAAKEIADGNHDFKTVVVDTVDNAYKFCLEHVCAKANIQHPSDLDFGKGYGMVNNEFQRFLTKLSLLPYGLILVSHAQDKLFKNKTAEITKTIPTLPDAVRKIVLGMADMILYADTETVVGADGKPQLKRVLRSKPNPNYEAGDRTGRLPEVFDLDYSQFLSHFNAAAPAAQTKAKKAA